MGEPSLHCAGSLLAEVYPIRRVVEGRTEWDSHLNFNKISDPLRRANELASSSICLSSWLAGQGVECENSIPPLRAIEW
jgi:hypothetical protein